MFLYARGIRDFEMELSAKNYRSIRPGPDDEGRATGAAGRRSLQQSETASCSLRIARPVSQYFPGTYNSDGRTLRSYSGLKTRSGSVISSCGTSS